MTASPVAQGSQRRSEEIGDGDRGAIWAIGDSLRTHKPTPSSHL